MVTKYYAGIGSRSTPIHIQELMTALATRLEQEGWVLRSGGAEGADRAFEAGVSSQKEIFTAKQISQNTFNTAYEAKQIVRSTHPAPERLKFYALDLLARDVYQVLGSDLKTPSSFIICWTEDGKLVGGTAQALRIAKLHHIPIFNLGVKVTEDFFRNNLDEALSTLRLFSP